MGAERELSWRKHEYSQLLLSEVGLSKCFEKTRKIMHSSSEVLRWTFNDENCLSDELPGIHSVTVMNENWLQWINEEWASDDH